MNDKSTKAKYRPVIGISIGDFNGIGPEVIIKSLDDIRVANLITPVIYASGGVISFYRKNLDRLNFNYNQINSIKSLNPKKINVLNVWSEKVEITPGVPNESGGIYAKKSLTQAVDDLKEGYLDGLITAPLSKELVADKDFIFPGHTEYLTNSFDAKDSLMLMVHDELRIGVVTGHIPLKDVSEKISKELIESKLSILLKTLQNDFAITKPKIAVLGLNPHAGENGLLGNEEIELIQPVIDSFKGKGHLIFGPYPSDGFFGTSQYLLFDGILAMYHDQGLVPFKLISGGEGVNFTAGLSIIRTSPAHGTAFNLAGKNLANPTSMRNALFLAHDLLLNKKNKNNS